VKVCQWALCDTDLLSGCKQIYAHNVIHKHGFNVKLRILCCPVDVNTDYEMCNLFQVHSSPSPPNSVGSTCQQIVQRECRTLYFSGKKLHRRRPDVTIKVRQTAEFQHFHSRRMFWVLRLAVSVIDTCSLHFRQDCTVTWAAVITAHLAESAR
jgi:hypothetical protein